VRWCGSVEFVCVWYCAAEEGGRKREREREREREWGGGRKGGNVGSFLSGEF